MKNNHLTVMLLLLFTVALGYCVIKPFIVPFAWASILAFVTWPVYLRVYKALGNRDTLAAASMTVFLILILITPILGLLVRLQSEIATAYQLLSLQLTDRPVSVPDWLAKIPAVGLILHDALAALFDNPALFMEYLKEWIEPVSRKLAAIVGIIGRNIISIIISVITLFYFYRNGRQITDQLRKALHKVVGEPAETYIAAMKETTFAVFYGLVVSAVAQGLVAAVGYQIFGLGTPILLGVVTAITSLIPLIGTVLVWGTVGVYFLLVDQVSSGLGMLAWGSFLVHPTDNILRPILISSTTNIPLLLVIFGVVGGLFAFGLVGLFLGPMILGVLLAIWREWLGSQLLHIPED